MFTTSSPVTPGTTTGADPRTGGMSKTSAKLLAGSVDTINTRRPPSARAIAVAAAQEVLPTPPLPVKNRNGVGAAKSPPSTRVSGATRSTDVVPVISAAARTAAAPTGRRRRRHRQRRRGHLQRRGLYARPHGQL